MTTGQQIPNPQPFDEPGLATLHIIYDPDWPPLAAHSKLPVSSLTKLGKRLMLPVLELYAVLHPESLIARRVHSRVTPPSVGSLRTPPRTLLRAVLCVIVSINVSDKRYLQVQARTPLGWKPRRPRSQRSPKSYKFDIFGTRRTRPTLDRVRFCCFAEERWEIGGGHENGFPFQGLQTHGARRASTGLPRTNTSETCFQPKEDLQRCCLLLYSLLIICLPIAPESSMYSIRSLASRTFGIPKTHDRDTLSQP